MVGAEVCDVVDSPGVNALEGVLSEDEHVTRRLLANRRRRSRRPGGRRPQPPARPDADGADSPPFGLPMVLVLNMVDEARRRGVEVDARRLVARAGHPGRRDGRDRRPRAFAELKEALREARPVARAVRGRRTTPPAGPTRPPGVSGGSGRRRSAASRSGWPRRRGEPLTGPPILALVLYVVYLFVGVFGAQTLVGLIEHGLFGRLHQPGRDGARRPRRAVRLRARLPRRASTASSRWG